MFFACVDYCLTLFYGLVEIKVPTGEIGWIE